MTKSYYDKTEIRSIIKRERFIAIMNAQKQSGKTSLLGDILRSRMKKGDEAYIFCDSIDSKDNDSWQRILKWLNRKNVEYYTHKSFKNEENENLISHYKHKWMESDDDSDVDDDEADPAIPANVTNLSIMQMYRLNINQHEPNNYAVTPPTIQQKKKKYPNNTRWVLIDDMSAMLRSKELYSLFTEIRHCRVNLIMCSHDIKDISPSMIQQADYIFIFPMIPNNRLKHIREQICYDPLPDAMYDTAKDRAFQAIIKAHTNQPFQFVLIDKTCMPAKLHKKFKSAIQI